MPKIINQLLLRTSDSHRYLIAATVVVPALLFGVVAWQDYGTVMRAARENVETVADTEREHALTAVATDDLLIELIDERIAKMSWDEISASREVHEFLASLKTRFPQVQAVWLLDADSQLRNSSQSFPSPRIVSARAQASFLAAKNGGPGLVIGQAKSTAFLAQRHFSLAKRRTTATGGFDGAIAVSILPDYFETTWKENWHRGAPGMTTALVRGDGHILARVPSTSIDRLIQPSGEIATAVQEHRNLTFRNRSMVDGVERIYAYRWLTPYDAYIVNGVSVASVLALWYRHLALYGVIFGTAAIGLCWMALVTSLRIGRERTATTRWLGAMDKLNEEAERRNLVERKLFQAEKLEALGQVTGQFAHDFGNILAAIDFSLESLRGALDDPTNIEILDTAMGETRRGTDAIRSLLTFVRRGSLTQQTIDLRKQLRGVSALLRQVLGSLSELEISVAPDTWSIVANSNQLELALLNLTVNARDAMPDGGKLTISAFNAVLDHGPKDLSGSFVALSVVDTGVGMTDAVAARAVEPFFTTKDEGRGTGLGLAQVYAFATQCGGTMVIESQLGRGTTVTLYLQTSPRPATTDHLPSAGATTPMADALPIESGSPALND